MNAGFRSASAIAVALLVAAALAASAFAHADLLRSTPRDGQELRRAPAAVVLTFSEGIEAAFVQLRVQDAAGRSVGRGRPFHPQGREEQLGLRLRPGLDGRFAVSYRVISEDGHPVTRRLSFTVRPPADEDEMAGPRPDQPGAGAMPPPGEAGAMPPAGGDGGAEHAETGPVTDVAFTLARGVGYLAMALAIGAMAFLLVVWLPALAHSAGAGAEWRALSLRCARLVRGIVLGGAALGVLATALAIVLEGATAAGVSFWAALDPDVLELVSDTRVVEAWLVRIIAWLALACVVVAIMRSRRMPVLQRATLGARGTAIAPGPSRTYGLLLVAAIGALVITAPAAGHAGSHEPSGLLICADTVHLLCMCVWLGGLVLLAVALPLAISALAAQDAASLLATVVGRFSRMALLAVTLLLLSGVVNSIVLVASFDALVETAYGRLVLAKITLFGAIVALGALNQRRLLPALRAAAARGDPANRTAMLLRRSVAFEVGFAVVVLSLTSVLVATQPSVGA